jgi:hypothetical protein
MVSITNLSTIIRKPKMVFPNTTFILFLCIYHELAAQADLILLQIFYYNSS